MIIMKPSKTSCATWPAGGKTRFQAPHSDRILVVDDEIAIRQLISDVLVGFGYHVDTAEDGALGWEALHSKSYDLLITDNNMPKVSGVELVKKLRSAGLALPVILISGAMPTEELIRHPWLEVAATLLKPFTAKGLLEIVSKVLLQTYSAREQIRSETMWRSHPSVQGLSV
jgi:two-component system chemotaxis response regulator CheY